MEILLTKTINGLMPLSEESAEQLKRFKLGSVIKCNISECRNYKFHKKLFALLNVGFSYWSPAELLEGKYGKPQKNFGKFRDQVTILAGYYEAYIDINGNERVTAKSISFASMKQDEFEKLYSAVLDVLLERIFVGYTDENVIQMAEQQLLGFA